MLSLFLAHAHMFALLPRYIVSILVPCYQNRKERERVIGKKGQGERGSLLIDHPPVYCMDFFPGCIFFCTLLIDHPPVYCMDFFPGCIFFCTLLIDHPPVYCMDFFPGCIFFWMYYYYYYYLQFTFWTGLHFLCQSYWIFVLIARGHCADRGTKKCWTCPCI